MDRFRLSSISASIVRYGLLLSAITPLVIVRLFWSPTNFGKVILFRVILELITPFWLYLLATDKKYRFKITPLAWAILAYAGIYLIAGFFGLSPARSFWGGWERMGGSFNLLHYVLFIFILASVFRKKEDWFLIFDLSIIVGCLSVLYGLLQRSNWSFIVGAAGRERIFGTVGNPAMFGGYLLILIFLALTRWQMSESRYRWSYLAAMALFSAGIFLTAVRGAVLAWFVSLILLAVLTRRQFFKKLLWPVVLVLIFVALLFVFDREILLRLFDFNVSRDTIIQRLSVWREAWHGFLSRPFLGWGPENFTILHERFFDPTNYVGPGGSIFDRAHNIFLDIVTSTGLAGLVVFSYLVFASLESIIKKYKEQIFVATALICLLATYAVQGFFFFDSFTVLYLSSITLAFVIWQSKSDVPDITELHTDNKSYAILTGALVVAVWLVFQYSVMPAMANTTSARAAVAFGQGDYQTGLDLWQKSLKYPMPQPYIQDMLVNVEPAFVSAFYQTQSNTDRNKLKQEIESFLYFYERGAKRSDVVSQDILAFDDLNLSYSDVGGNKLADSEDILKKQLAQTPKIIFLWQELGNIQQARGEYSDAVASYQKAYDLQPSYLPSLFDLGKAEILAGTKDKGFADTISAFDKGYNERQDLFWLGSELKSAGKISLLIDLLKQLSVKDPNMLLYLAIAQKDAGLTLQAHATADLLLNYTDTHPDAKISSQTYSDLADLYKALNDIHGRTEAFQKAGLL